MKEVSHLRGQVEPWQALERRLSDLVTLVELAEEAGDGDGDLRQEIAQELRESARQLDDLELQATLSGEHDASNAILSINAGAGGTESCDWVDMLCRMYTRWAERRGYEWVITDLLPGEIAGYKNVTLHIKGPYAYGYLRSENGVHRLVRISPFDASRRRHTSFASVDVLPEVSEDIEVEVRDDDLRVDTYRSSGAGGQHVNKTDSAVRMTHLPTGIVVQCQNERSQHANRREAMMQLRAKLYERQRQEKAKEIAALRGEQTDIAWGNQIRSYVLQPFTLVKDLRTDYETSDAAGVLDGDLDEFMRAYLRWAAGREARQ
jgi:peptide chain release factor 2